MGFNFNAFFLYILSAPMFLSTHLGLEPTEYSWLFIPSIAGILVGSQLSGRAAGKLSRAQTIRRAYTFMGISAAANVAYSLRVRAVDPVGRGSDLLLRHRLGHGDADHLPHHARSLSHAARHGGVVAGLRLRA